MKQLNLFEDFDENGNPVYKTDYTIEVNADYVTVEDSSTFWDSSTALESMLISTAQDKATESVSKCFEKLRTALMEDSRAFVQKRIDELAMLGYTVVSAKDNCLSLKLTYKEPHESGSIFIDITHSGKEKSYVTKYVVVDYMNDDSRRPEPGTFTEAEFQLVSEILQDCFWYTYCE